MRRWPRAPPESPALLRTCLRPMNQEPARHLHRHGLQRRSLMMIWVDQHEHVLPQRWWETGLRLAGAIAHLIANRVAHLVRRAAAGADPVPRGRPPPPPARSRHEEEDPERHDRPDHQIPTHAMPPAARACDGHYA